MEGSDMSKILNVDFLAAVGRTAEKFLKRAGARAKVTVRASGPTAWTQFERTAGGRLKVTLNMPALPVSGDMTRAHADDLVAYVLHEISHNLWTDAAAWKQAVRTFTPYQHRDAFHHMINALEDVRIEKKSIQENIAGRFQECLEGLCDGLHKEAVANGFDANTTAGM